MTEHYSSEPTIRRSMPNNRLLIIVATVSVLFFLIITVISAIKYHSLNQTHLYEQELKKTVAIIPALEQQKTTFEKSNNEDQKKLDKIKKFETTEKNTPYPYLKEIAHLIPNTAVLKSFKFSKHLIELRGHATQLSSVQTFMNSLNKSKIFSSPQLVSIEHQQGTKPTSKNESTMVTFIINIKVK